MKKLFILSTMLTLAGCACWNSDEPEVIYETRPAPAPVAAPAPAPQMDCDYVEGNVCYRYVRRSSQVVMPAETEVVRYREPGRRVYRKTYTTTTCTDCENQVAYAPAGDELCPPKIRTTREPVEVVYRKTTYKTVYEPKTFSSVSYEKEPYRGQVSTGSYRVRNNNEYIVVNGNNDEVFAEEN